MPPKHDQPAPADAASSCFAPGRRSRGDAEEDHVVHDGAGARPDARRRRVGVLRELRIEQEAAVVVGDAGLRLRVVRRRHREREQALAGANLGRHSGRLADRARRLPARLRPAHERRSLGRRQLPGVLADVLRRRRARRPRRHDLRIHGRADRLRPLRGLLRRLERERRDPAELVATRALLAEDRGNVSLEARRSGGRAIVPVAARGGDGDDRHEQRGGDGGCDWSAPHAAGRCAS